MIIYDDMQYAIYDDIYDILCFALSLNEVQTEGNSKMYHYSVTEPVGHKTIIHCRKKVKRVGRT